MNALEPETGYSIDEIRNVFAEIADGETFYLVTPEFFCREVVGHADVKLGILLCLVNRFDPAPGERDRINVLLYGEPGCGKTVFIDHLRDWWGALYIAGDARKSALKGDGRRTDGGARLFARYHGGIVAHDEIEAFSDINTLRDVLESGRYTEVVSGRYKQFDAQIRYVAAANNISKIPAPILSRFDLVYRFDMPDPRESIQIARSLISGLNHRESINRVMQAYVALATQLSPKLQPETEDELNEKIKPFEHYFSRSSEGQSGRWISSVLRIAKGVARLKLADKITPDDISTAIQLKTASDRNLVA